MENKKKKQILWLSAKSYAFKTNMFEGLSSDDVSSYSLTMCYHIDDNLIESIKNGQYSYIILILSEAVLVMGYQEEYRNSFDTLLNAIVSSDTPHIVAINDAILSSNPVICEKDYSLQYALYPYYALHSIAFKKALLKDYYTDKDERFERDYNKFSFLYKENLISAVYDNGCGHLFDLLLASELYFGYFTSEESEFLLKHIESEVFIGLDNANDYFYKHHHYNCHFHVEPSEAEEQDYPEALPKEYFVGARSYMRRYSKKRHPETFYNTLDNKIYAGLVDMLVLNMEGDTLLSDIIRQFEIDYGKSIVSTPGINIISWSKLDDVYNQLSEYISEQGHVVSRTYVTGDDDYINEFDRLIDLFKEYMVSVKGTPITVEKQYTSSGIIYTFKSTITELNEDELLQDENEFQSFMRLVRFDTKKAEQLLHSHIKDDEKTLLIMRRFQKECLRLEEDFQETLERHLAKIQQNTVFLPDTTIQADVTELIKTGFSPSQSSGLTYLNEPAYTQSETEIIDAINSFANPVELNSLLKAVMIISDAETRSDIRTQELYKIKRFRNIHSTELTNETAVSFDAYIRQHDKKLRY